METTERLNKVRQLLIDGKTEVAAKECDDLRREDPENPTINYLAAWACDSQGSEAEAAFFYEKALENGITGDDLRGAMLGLGSTYRNLGEIRKSYRILREGLEKFPDGKEFEVFYALTLYSAGKYRESVTLLLKLLATTTSDPRIKEFERALLQYADNPGTDFVSP